MNSTHNTKTAPTSPARVGRKRRWGRFDLPIIRPGTSRAKLARKLV